MLRCCYFRHNPSTIQAWSGGANEARCTIYKEVESVRFLWCGLETSRNNLWSIWKSSKMVKKNPMDTKYSVIKQQQLGFAIGDKNVSCPKQGFQKSHGSGWHRVLHLRNSARKRFLRGACMEGGADTCIGGVWKVDTFQKSELKGDLTCESEVLFHVNRRNIR